MSLKILTEASGSLTSAYLIKATKEAGFHAIASDIDDECFAKHLADSFILMPQSDDKHLWTFLDQVIQSKHINVIIPSLDETLAEWAKRQSEYRNKGVKVIISEESTIATCQDKWLTYQFFQKNGIPTPKTSLTQDFQLVKPRHGRGSEGVQVTDNLINMKGMVSQEYIEGTEFTVDVLCDVHSNPIYIVPRKRVNVKDGKSTAGEVIKDHRIIRWVERICHLIPFKGPINIQCMKTKNDEVKFIEINPRVAGGMALSFAATENWIKVIVNHFINQKETVPKPIQNGLKMKRYYNEVFYK